MDRGVRWASPWGHKRVRHNCAGTHTQLYLSFGLVQEFSTTGSSHKLVWKLTFCFLLLICFFFFFSFKLPGQLLDRSWKSFLPKTSDNKDGMVGTLHSRDCCWDPRTFDHASEGKLCFTSWNAGSPPDSGQARTVRAFPCLSEKYFPNFWFTEENFWLKPVLCCF